MAIAGFSFDFFAAFGGLVVESGVVSFLCLALTEASPGAAAHADNEHEAS